MEDKIAGNRNPYGRSQGNINLVHASVVEQPKRSIRQSLQQVELSEITTWGLLPKELAQKAKSVQITGKLNGLDHLKHCGFVNSIRTMSYFVQTKKLS